jgi:hypothetical protein
MLTVGLTDFIAGYAALVASVVGLYQIRTYYQDRRDVKVSVRHDMEMQGFPVNRTGITVVSVGNNRRRPVTITAIGAIRDISRKSLLFDGHKAAKIAVQD